MRRFLKLFIGVEADKKTEIITNKVIELRNDLIVGLKCYTPGTNATFYRSRFFSGSIPLLFYLSSWKSVTQEEFNNNLEKSSPLSQFLLTAIPGLIVLTFKNSANPAGRLASQIGVIYTLN